MTNFDNSGRQILSVFASAQILSELKFPEMQNYTVLDNHFLPRKKPVLPTKYMLEVPPL
ncbi:MAG: hypothetical protein M3Q99_02755 [Acidobacteriota bacterium]|nr:hypothetical protein [Acidobacteriota bacterium]